MFSHSHLLHLGAHQDESTTLYNNLKSDFSQEMFSLAQARDLREVNDCLLFHKLLQKRSFHATKNDNLNVEFYEMGPESTERSQCIGDKVG